MSNDNLQNPEFKTTIFFGMKSLTKQEILTVLEKDNFIYRDFKKYGIIDSKKYSFITKVTFSKDEKNCVEGAKDEDEKLQAIENLKIVQDYFNSLYPSIIDGVNINPLRVLFTSCKDNECVLYNPDRYTGCKLQMKFEEIFG